MSSHSSSNGNESYDYSNNDPGSVNGGFTNGYNTEDLQNLIWREQFLGYDYTGMEYDPNSLGNQILAILNE